MLEGRSRVAEHVLDFKTESEMVMGWLLRFFHFEVGEQIAGTYPDIEVVIHSGYGEPFKNYDVDISRKDGDTIYDRADYKVTVNAEHSQAEVRVYDFFALKHALMNLYSAFIVHNRWGLLIHSSCVIEGERAYVFSGRSGAGKSTIARLSHPRPLLSDEATIVKVSGDSVQVYDSPFRSDTQPEYRAQPMPLAAIHLIHQSKDVRRERTQMTEGVVQLMDKVFYWSYSPEQTRAILRMYEQLVKQVPIYDLHFQKNNTFWEAIS